jgi:signal peptidase I
MQKSVKPELTARQPTNPAASVDIPANEGVDIAPRARPRSSWRSLAEIVVMLLILFGLWSFLTVDAEVSGSSMAPGLAGGQRVLASRITYVLLPPVRGDVVLLRDPLSTSRLQVRRVIGLPGERLELRGRQVLINGQPLNEDYIGNPLTVSDNLTATSLLQLQPDEYYVLGDNRLSINDSRSWGPVKGDDIVGRAWLSYWPPEAIGFVQQERYDRPVEQPSVTP